MCKPERGKERETWKEKVSLWVCVGVGCCAAGVSSVVVVVCVAYAIG